MLKIRNFRSEEWRLYKALRLRSLRDAPDAFGSTWARESPRPDEEWMARLSDVDDRSSFPVVAFGDDEPVGLAWGRIEAAAPERADLYQMWVSPDYRGRGVGRRLLDAVLHWASERTEYMVLGVTLGNDSALALYESAGFQAFGEPEELRPGSDKLVQSMKRDF
ncbi:MAG: GNAT family N-acetyltransferase [Pseudomonadales bacterium]|nr:GNAT family N-acetyltransferase [Pseudomonadales bacterium]MBO6595844.1 GNAT family N-acetyltransferase [Pseudomonadales bacterium]MBO6702449.1 GNAT family N-acetyltransferase [Pseudomonadales bacterium]MBO6822328.1 GNAT family N-acetyltransferase [Pseudomonadales bacterium]MBO7005843.1 GNAT family N-acetyltransferase [Pseudomonadales bacterium]